MEKDIEKKLILAVKKRGGMCPKFVSPAYNGMPDRIILLPNGRVAFVELKDRNKKPRPIQRVRHCELKKMGFLVYVIDSIEKIGGTLDEIQAP